MGARVVDFDELYPGRFFKAGLLKEGERKVLTISDVAVEPLESDKGVKDKGILSFANEKLQLALNKTNGLCLREMFGRKVQEWKGHSFAIFVSEWNGEPCIRIWGSPELTEDMDIVVQLPRKKPLKMVMHAMGNSKPKLAPAPAAEKAPMSEECSWFLKQMGAAETVEALMDIEADFAMRDLSPGELAFLGRAMAKRKGQLQ
jgi:hypothetical protein